MRLPTRLPASFVAGLIGYTTAVVSLRARSLDKAEDCFAGKDAKPFCKFKWSSLSTTQKSALQSHYIQTIFLPKCFIFVFKEISKYLGSWAVTLFSFHSFILRDQFSRVNKEELTLREEFCCKNCSSYNKTGEKFIKTKSNRWWTPKSVKISWHLSEMMKLWWKAFARNIS